MTKENGGVVSDDLTIPRPAYRGANRRGSGMEPGTKRLLAIAGVLGVGLVAVVGASGFARRHSTDIPVVQADDRPIKVKPENAGGLQVANANNEIFSGGSDTDGSKLAPEPEVPNPTALRAPPPAAALAQAGPPTPAASSSQPSQGSAPPTQPRLAKPVPATIEPPVAKPLAVPVPSATDKHPTSAAPAKGAIVQLAALTTEDAARVEWQLLERRMPDLLVGHQPSFSRTERDGHTFWRVRATGFADVAQAKSFCDHVRAKGAACAVVDF